MIPSDLKKWLKMRIPECIYSSAILLYIEALEEDVGSKIGKNVMLENRIKRLEEVVMLMVLQYCQADGKLDHMYMCAGEQAFAALGLKQYDPIETLHKLMDDAGVI